MHPYLAHIEPTVPRSPTTFQPRSARRLLNVPRSSTLWSPTSSPGSAARRMSSLVSCHNSQLDPAIPGCRKLLCFVPCWYLEYQSFSTFLVPVATSMWHILLLSCVLITCTSWFHWCRMSSLHWWAIHGRAGCAYGGFAYFNQSMGSKGLVVWLHDKFGQVC